jgi:hypothetical protein
VIVIGYGSDVEKVVPTLYPYRAKTQVFFREDGGQDPRLLLVGPSFPEETSWGLHRCLQCGPASIGEAASSILLWRAPDRRWFSQ